MSGAIPLNEWSYTSPPFMTSCDKLLQFSPITKLTPNSTYPQGSHRDAFTNTRTTYVQSNSSLLQSNKFPSHLRLYLGHLQACQYKEDIQGGNKHLRGDWLNKRGLFNSNDFTTNSLLFFRNLRSKYWTLYIYIYIYIYTYIHTYTHTRRLCSALWPFSPSTRSNWPHSLRWPAYLIAVFPQPNNFRVHFDTCFDNDNVIFWWDIPVVFNNQ
jgi:hypothetical protein